MQKKQLLSLLALALLTACATTIPSDMPGKNASGVTFTSFYANLQKEAAAKGYNPADLDAAFAGKPAPINAVVKSEQSQPELVRTFAEYTGAMLSSNRIGQGVSNIREHAADLNSTAARTGVSASVVVALWGIETNFGKVQGEHPVIPALVTLAWQSPRADYFRKETFAALEVLKKTGKQPPELIGSWAGAMGQCQFMPSSYLAYATDGDNDGKADIWGTQADVFASAATYLQKRGWKKSVPWRLSVNEGINTSGLKLNSRGLSEPQPLSYWHGRGFQTPKGLSLNTSESFRYYKPQDGGPAYLLGPNFSTILSWNNSSYFAWSVLSLADTIEQESTQ
jgi:membrane-bound lytic murein transglycosylase B